MKALQIECQTRAWWGELWRGDESHAFDARLLPDTNELPNAPLAVHVLTPDPAEAVRLLRALADELEQRPALVQALADEDA